MIRRPNERVELRLDVSPAASAPKGALAKLLRATGSARRSSATGYRSFQTLLTVPPQNLTRRLQCWL